MPIGRGMRKTCSSVELGGVKNHVPSSVANNSERIGGKTKGFQQKWFQLKSLFLTQISAEDRRNKFLAYIWYIVTSRTIHIFPSKNLDALNVFRREIRFARFHSFHNLVVSHSVFVDPDEKNRTIPKISETF